METIKFSECPELIQPNLKINDVKRIIKEKTGIIEQNQRFHVYFDFFDFMYFDYSDTQSFWKNFKIEIYDKTRYITTLKRNFYEKELILDLTKTIDELKQMIYEQTKIPINRQQFYLGNELKLESSLENINLFQSNLSIKISEQFNDNILVKYPDSTVKNLKVDLCNTVLDILDKDIGAIDKFPGSVGLYYNLSFNGKILPLNSLLIFSGIKSGDELE